MTVGSFRFMDRRFIAQVEEFLFTSFCTECAIKKSLIILKEKLIINGRKSSVPKLGMKITILGHKESCYEENETLLSQFVSSTQSVKKLYKFNFLLSRICIICVFSSTLIEFSMLHKVFPIAKSIDGFSLPHD